MLSEVESRTEICLFLAWIQSQLGVGKLALGFAPPHELFTGIRPLPSLPAGGCVGARGLVV